MTFLENLRELALVNCVIPFLIGFIAMFMNGLEVYAILLLLADTRNVPNIVFVSLLSAFCLAIDSLIVLTIYAVYVRPSAFAQRLASREPVVHTTSLRGVNPLRIAYEP